MIVAFRVRLTDERFSIELTFIHGIGVGRSLAAQAVSAGGPRDLLNQQEPNDPTKIAGTLSRSVIVQGNIYVVRLVTLST